MLHFMSFDEAKGELSFDYDDILENDVGEEVVTIVLTDENKASSIYEFIVIVEPFPVLESAFNFTNMMQTLNYTEEEKDNKDEEV